MLPYIVGGGGKIVLTIEMIAKFPPTFYLSWSQSNIQIRLRNTGSYHRELSAAVLHVLGVEGAVLKLLLLALLLLYTSLLIRSNNN